jgi:hypothetical protein
MRHTEQTPAYCQRAAQGNCRTDREDAKTGGIAFFRDARRSQPGRCPLAAFVVETTSYLQRESPPLGLPCTAAMPSTAGLVGGENPGSKRVP